MAKDIDLSVFRKQRKILQKKEKKRKKGDVVMAIPREHQVKDEKIIGEIRALENRIIEDVAMKRDIEREMGETRRIMYVVLAVTLAIFAFLIGVLLRYLGQ
jgi:hypothetical protein